MGPAHKPSGPAHTCRAPEQVRAQEPAPAAGVMVSPGLLDSHGMPSMIYGRTVQHITAGGIVPGQTETQVVLPKVTFTIGGGIELTTDVSVTQEAKGWDLLVSMADIKRLAAMGAEFRPCD